MQKIISILHLLIALALIGAIVIQAKGKGLGSFLGGDSGTYHSKRGVEKTLFIATIVLAVLFLLTSIANILG